MTWQSLLSLPIKLYDGDFLYELYDENHKFEALNI